MGIQIALDHSVASDLMKRTEAKDGYLEKCSIKLRGDIPHYGFAPYPENHVTAYKVEKDGEEAFLFFNEMDDYSRASVMTRDCLESVDFIENVTPHADRVRLDAKLIADRESARQEAIKKENDRKEQENRVYLEAYSKLCAHLGQDVPANVDYNVRFAAERILEIERLQGGKLNLNICSFDFSNLDAIDSATINRQLIHTLYKLKYQHDIEFKLLSDEKIEISFNDLKGNTVSKGVFGFYESDAVVEYCDEYRVSPVNITLATIDVEDDVFPPEITERGRPVLLKDSKFRDAYLALQDIEFMDKEYVEMREGPAVEKNEVERMNLFARNILESGRLSNRILNEITSRARNNEHSNLGFG